MGVKKKLKDELLHVAKMTGMMGMNNKYIESGVLLKETLALLDNNVPILHTRDEYVTYLNEKAMEKSAYEELARKYAITKEQVAHRLLSHSNIYNLVSTLD